MSRRRATHDTLGLLTGFIALYALLFSTAAFPTQSPSTEEPWLRGREAGETGKAVDRTESYLEGGGNVRRETRPPETQVITQKIFEALGEPLYQTLPPVATFRAPADESESSSGEGQQQPGDQNYTEDKWPLAAEDVNATSQQTNTSIPAVEQQQPGNNKQDIAEMQESMEKIKSALKQLEDDIERKKKMEEDGFLAGPQKGAPTQTANPTSVTGADHQGELASVTRERRLNEEKGSGSQQMPFLLQSLKPSQQVGTQEEREEGDYPMDNQQGDKKQINRTAAAMTGGSLQIDGDVDVETNSSTSSSAEQQMIGQEDDQSEEQSRLRTETPPTDDNEMMTTQTVWKWNIQNGTNYTEPPTDVEPGVPLGKVCILLNGTVVKDMEESDCKGNAGLHYKYVPARLRKNGTLVNSTTNSYYGNDTVVVVDDGIDPEGLEGGAPTWEDAQWDLYNSQGAGRNVTSGESDSHKGEQLLTPEGALQWPPQPQLSNSSSDQLLNISDSLKPQLNETATGANVPGADGNWQSERQAYVHYVETDKHADGETPLRDGFPIDVIPSSQSRGNQTNGTTSHMFVAASGEKSTLPPLQINKTSGPWNAKNSLNQMSLSPSLPAGNGSRGGSNYSQPFDGIFSNGGITGGGRPIKDGQNSNPWELAREKQAKGATVMLENTSSPPVSPAPSGTRTENESAIKDAGKELADSKISLMVPNVKFMREPITSTQKPQSVHIHRSRYPPHAVQGLIWEDRRYMVSVLVPVACGMAGAFLIVCLAYLSRNCRFRQPKVKELPKSPPQLTQFDRVMLLADSSDDDF